MTHPNAPSGQPYSPPPPVRTPQEWEQAKGVWVIDPGGWRYNPAGGPKDFGEPISEYEFDQRAAASTVDHRPSYSSDAAGGKKRSWPARHKVPTAVLALVGAFLVLGGIGVALGGSTSSSGTAAPAPSASQDATTGTQLDPNYTPPSSAPPAPTSTGVVIKPKPAPKPAAPELTVGQEQAIGAAEEYLSSQAFSRVGLIDQLSSDYGSGFSRADARFAVDHLSPKPDWNEQAVRAAKEYLASQHFSRSGLIDQLSSQYGSQFTRAQAAYAADKVGL